MIPARIDTSTGEVWFDGDVVGYVTPTKKMMDAFYARRLSDIAKSANARAQCYGMKQKDPWAIKSSSLYIANFNRENKRQKRGSVGVGSNPKRKADYPTWKHCDMVAIAANKRYERFIERKDDPWKSWANNLASNLTKRVKRRSLGQAYTN